MSSLLPFSISMSSNQPTSQTTVPSQDSQTHFRMSYVSSHTSFVMEAENICHYPHTNSIVMFHPKHPDIETHHFESDCMYWISSILNPSSHLSFFFPSLLFFSLLAFAWGWQFNWGTHFNKNSLFPKLQDVVIAVAPFNNHIYHAVEGLGFLLVKLFEPSSLPPFQHVFIPSLSNSDMVWIREFVDMFLSLFPEDFRLHVYITEDIDEMMRRMGGYGEKICFEKAVGWWFPPC